MPNVWDDLTDHQGQRCWEGTPRANSCMWSGVLTNQRCAHGRRVGPGVQGSNTVQRVPEERRRGRGGSGKIEGGFRGLGLTQFILVNSGGPCFTTGIGKGRQTCSTTAPQESQLQGCIPQAGVTPPLLLWPAGCFLFPLPPLFSLLPLPFLAPSLPLVLLSFCSSSLAVCVSDFSLPASAPLHQGAL